MMPYPQTLTKKPEEATDVVKKFTNIDNEDFRFTWDSVQYLVKAGETKDLPLYLVNYAAYHLARKIFKRKARAEAEKRGLDLGKGEYKISDEEEEEKLRKEIVAANLPEITLDKEPEKKEEEKKIEGNPLKCSQCEFIAKSKFGLTAHSRKHKK